MITSWWKYLQRWKIALFSWWCNFWPSEQCKSSQKSASPKFAAEPIKIENRIKNSKKMLKSCQETSKLSVDSFMDPYDFIVPQKWKFSKKIVEKVLITCLTPPAYRNAWYLSKALAAQFQPKHVRVWVFFSKNTLQNDFRSGFLKLQNLWF